MSAPTGWLLAAAVCFALQLAYAVTMIAAASLSRVALHRLAGDSAPWAFLATLRDMPSLHRTAAAIARQAGLLGGVLSVALAARAMQLDHPSLVGVAAGAGIGLLLLELLVARSIAFWNPRLALRLTAPLVVLAAFVLYPLVRPVNLLLAAIARRQQEDESEEEQDEEVEAYIEVGEREGILEASESEMMRSIVDLDETKVREIMTPRTAIIALPEDATAAHARGVCLEAGHSRLPVYRDSIDNVVGLLHVRDLLRAWAEGRAEGGITPYLREVMFVPEPLSVAELLAEMRVKSHMAIVVDEYGGVAGLVTLEDLLEEIVGEIRDEHDAEEAAEVVRETDGVYQIRATAHVEELETLFGVELGERDFDTIGGLVVSTLGRVPETGEVVESHGLRIEIREADPRRIHLVRVRRAALGEQRAG